MKLGLTRLEYIEKHRQLISNARKLSKDQIKHATKHEKFLRRELIIRGIKHKFQYPIVIYPTYACLDFYFPKAKLCVEVDGEHHYTKGSIIKDQERSIKLSKKGIKVIRFRNNEVLKDKEAVISKILHYLK